MKTFVAALLALSVIVLFTSCQKDFSVSSFDPSEGSLKNSSTGECLGNVVSGSYKAGEVMSTSNSVSLQVNVAVPGSYSISTNKVNGYSFSAQGVFETTGFKNVVLEASGLPLTAGTDDFTVTYDSTTCQFAVVVLPGAANTAAVFTLGGAGAACTGATLQGTYTAGTALNSTNKLSIQVNVTTIGSYTISSTAVNGITFSASGTFTATGIQNVILSGTGTPAVAGINNVAVNNGLKQCSFTLTVQPATAATAVFSLTSSATVCSNAEAQGTYALNTLLGPDNTVTLQVNVASVGAWSVNTANVNGISFSGSGNFTGTGIQTITLSGSGTPTVAGPNLLSFTAGNSSCSFTIPVSNNASLPPCNVTNNTALFNNLPDIPFYSVHGAPGGGSYLITGNGSGGDVTIEFAGAVQPAAGIYRIQSIAGSFDPGDVRVSFVNSSIYWQSSSGTLYVTIANGKVTSQFCNVSFSGSLGGPSYTTIASAKVTETN